MTGSVHERSTTDAIYLDFCKILKIISHSVFVAKPGRYGLGGWVRRCVVNWLNHQAQRIAANGSQLRGFLDLTVGLTLFNVLFSYLGNNV